MELYYILGILLIPAILFSLIAQGMVSTRFKKYAKVYSEKGYTAFQVARMLLDSYGLHHIRIIRVSGELSDYYDNGNQTIALSDSTIESSSLAALGVAAHEVGHAVQYQNNYLPIKFKNSLVPMVNLCNRALMPITMISILLGLIYIDGMFGAIFAAIGLTVFGATMLFQLVTLPCEFNASKRAMKMLVQNGIISKKESRPAKKVLNAAAMTYLAAFFLALMSFVRILIIVLLARGKND